MDIWIPPVELQTSWKYIWISPLELKTTRKDFLIPPVELKTPGRKDIWFPPVELWTPRKEIWIPPVECKSPSVKFWIEKAFFQTPPVKKNSLRWSPVDSKSYYELPWLFIYLFLFLFIYLSMCLFQVQYCFLCWNLHHTTNLYGCLLHKVRSRLRLGLCVVSAKHKKGIEPKN